MTETNGQHTNGASRPTPAADKTALTNAIEKIDALKGSVRDALNGLAELAALLRQSARNQKAGEKEIQQVRQTLRSLQGVRI